MSGFTLAPAHATPFRRAFNFARGPRILSKAERDAWAAHYTPQMTVSPRTPTSTRFIRVSRMASNDNRFAPMIPFWIWQVCIGALAPRHYYDPFSRIGLRILQRMLGRNWIALQEWQRKAASFSAKPS